MKRLLFLASLLFTLPVNAATPSFASFNTNDFIVAPSLVSPKTISINGTLGLTNLYVTNIYATNITVNNLYATNVFTTNFFSFSTNVYVTNLTVVELTVITNITIGGTNVAVINPTDLHYPYRASSNSFGDGAIIHIDANTAGVDEMDIGTLVVTNLMSGGVVISDTTGTLTNVALTTPYIPYATATDLGDSPLKRVDASTVSVTHTGTNSIELIGGNVGTLLFHSPVGSPSIIQSDTELYYSLEGLGSRFRMGNLLFTPLSVSQASLGEAAHPWQFTYTDSVGWGGHTASYDSGAGVDPEGVVTADPGSIWRNTTAGTIWKKATGVGNTGWVELSSGAGTINPTNDYLPVRSNATTFVDSPLYRVGLTNVATDGQVIFGPGTTNVLYRNSTDLVSTNGASLSRFTQLNGNGNGVSLVAQSATGLLSAAGGSTTVGLQSGASTLVLYSGLFEPTTDLTVSLGSQARSYANTYTSNLFVRGFLGAVTNYSQLAILHSGTNGAAIYDSQSAGTAGSPRNHRFDLGATNQFAIGDGWVQLMRGMTKAEKATITATNGMVVYQTDNTPGLRAYVNGSWVMISTVADP